MPRKPLWTALAAGLALSLAAPDARAEGPAAGAPAPAGIAWIDSMQDGQAAAKAQVRPLLLFFHADT